MRAAADEILQRIYDDEINFAVASFGPEGLEWRMFDGDMQPVAEGCADSLAEAAVALAEAVLDAFPETHFATWWRARRTQGPRPPALRDPCPLCGNPVKAMASHGDIWRFEHTKGGPCRGRRGLKQWERLPIPAIS